MMKRLVAGGLAARKPMAANAAPVSPTADSGADPAQHLWRAVFRENNTHPSSSSTTTRKMGNRMSISGLSAHKALDASQLMSNATVGGEVLVLFLIIFFK
jgi:succinylarginine dihydrolase